MGQLPTLFLVFIADFITLSAKKGLEVWQTSAVDDMAHMSIGYSFRRGDGKWKYSCTQLRSIPMSKVA